MKSSNSPPGIIACGHQQTAEAAKQIMQAGGNAFDAIVAAHFAACVAEPVLASLAGGGFLLAHEQAGKNTLYDFFAHTPGQQRNFSETDFYPIHADFGTTTQEFHIGLGSIAVPGAIKGLFEIHKDLCTLPMHELMQPAIELARHGVQLNAFQAYIFTIINPILLATDEAKSLYGSDVNQSGLLEQHDLFHMTDFAEFLEALSREGEALFYHGDIAHQISQLCQTNGGHLSIDDLNQYRVIKREPLNFRYRNSTVLTNPPPSSGGILLAFALKLINSLQQPLPDFDSADYLSLLTNIMSETNKARVDYHAGNNDNLHSLLDQEFLSLYQQNILGRQQSLRGTTHISIMDKQGNMASMTLSNGEGSGHIIPGTGIMLNNMLGEEDLNPHGFNQWPINHRMTSMMSPSIVLSDDGRQFVMGSGGSNRIRTALLQVVINILEHNMSLEDAIHAPRIHFENGTLNIENDYSKNTIDMLTKEFPQHKLWDSRNLFFGGAHAVLKNKGSFTGYGDQRRGGVTIIVEN